MSSTSEWEDIWERFRLSLHADVNTCSSRAHTPHRFGVSQREKLARNVGHPVHTLLMTATPIPRTLALAQYGSLVLSSINEMPPGRRVIETRVVFDSEVGREEVSRGRRRCDRVSDCSTCRRSERDCILAGLQDHPR